MKEEKFFFVCFFKDKSGRRAGHMLSNKNDFVSDINKFIELKANNSSKSASKFEEIFKVFCISMLGYIEMLPFIASIAPVVSLNLRYNVMGEFCERHSAQRISEEKREIFKIPTDNYPEFLAIDNRRITGEVVGRQIPKMLMIGIVSSYEHHASLLMREILKSYPKMISDSDKQVQVKDIFEASSLDDFKEFLLDREIESITRDSFEEQISWFEKRLNLSRKIMDDFPDWESLIEVFERRNLFAHADGIANTKYIKKIGKKDKNKIEKGQELLASPKYFANSLELICEFGLKLIQVVWRKLYGDESKIADDRLGAFGYDLIERGEYKLASRVLEFSRQLKGKREESRRRMDIVNLANSYKLLKDESKSKEVLDSEDWSIVSDDFAVSVAAVRGDVNGVVALMRRMATAKDFDEKIFEQWPVFFSIRDDSKFTEGFDKIFGRKFVPMPDTRHKLMKEFSKSKDLDLGYGKISIEEDVSEATESGKIASPGKASQKIVKFGIGKRQRSVALEDTSIGLFPKLNADKEDEPKDKSKKKGKK